MDAEVPLLVSQSVVEICLIALGSSAIVGGLQQMVLDQPEASPRLDHVHRFMAGIISAAV